MKGGDTQSTNLRMASAVPDSQAEILYILMDFAKHGELFDVIAQTGRFSEPVARHYILELLQAVDYMHNEAEVCHLDLKP